jgi:hypothetical protein
MKVPVYTPNNDASSAPWYQFLEFWNGPAIGQPQTYTVTYQLAPQYAGFSNAVNLAIAELERDFLAPITITLEFDWGALNGNPNLFQDPTILGHNNFFHPPNQIPATFQQITN